MPADVVRVLSFQARSVVRAGRAREALESALRAQELAEIHGGIPLDVRCELHWIRSSAAYSLGDSADQLEQVLAGLRLAEELQDPAVTLNGLTYLGTALGNLGVRSAQRAVADRCIALAREGRHLAALADGLVNQCSDVYSEDLEAAAGLTHEAVEVARQLGDHYITDVILTNAGYVWWLGGDWDRLMAETEEWLSGSEVSVTSAPLWLGRAQVHAARGEPFDAPVVPSSDDYYDRQVAAVVSALDRVAADGRSAAADAAAATLASFADGENMSEDFEMLWAPAMELQLRDGRSSTPPRPYWRSRTRCSAVGAAH